VSFCRYTIFTSLSLLPPSFDHAYSGNSGGSKTPCPTRTSAIHLIEVLRPHHIYFYFRLTFAQNASRVYVALRNPNSECTDLLLSAEHLHTIIIEAHSNLNCRVPGHGAGQCRTALDVQVADLVQRT